MRENEENRAGTSVAHERADDDPVDHLLPWAWGKTNAWRGGELTHWLPLTQHLEDAAHVAGWLWDEWAPQRVRDRLSDDLGGAAAARALLVFLAGVHDVGKATPAFALGERRLAQRMQDAGWPFPSSVHAEERPLLPHGRAGHVIVNRYLAGFGWSNGEADRVAAVVGGHHGVPPTSLELIDAERRTALMGRDPVWASAQNRVVEQAVQRAGLDLGHLREHLPGMPVQALLTGLVIAADWIASTEWLFELSPLDRQPLRDPNRASRALSRLGLSHRWDLLDSGASPEEMFAARYLDLGASAIRPVQDAAVRAARECDVPGLLIVEAPMGEGKTEAAFMAAEILAARSGAGGFFLALPTQATTNAMFGRVLAWLEYLAGFADDSRARRAVSLLHGKARLNPLFKRLDRGTSRSPSRARVFEEDGRSSQAPYVHHWMMSPKRSPLSDVVVGTVDQVLFGALQARHLALRHLGLAGKVIIIDEVHSYDAYMNSYLERSLEWLGSYGAPVVMLSATLPRALRSQLVEAYQRGLKSRDEAPTRPPVPAWKSAVQAQGKGAQELRHDGSDPKETILYPAVTTLHDGVIVTEEAAASARRTDVQLVCGDDSDRAIVAELRDRLADGGCAAVIRNTVGRAQATYEAVAAEFPEGEVTLVHARFLAADRAAMDATLLDRFGPGVDGRPRRHVVVATQVIEQSLDVDFDLLVTDLAPIDLIFQRIGRLHRHLRARPAAVAEPTCVVVGAENWAADPPEPNKPSRYVYQEYDLLQAAALLRDRARSEEPLSVPGDIAPWVARAYGAGATPERWATSVAKARRAREEAQQEQLAKAVSFQVDRPRPSASLVGWLSRSLGEVGDEERGRAQVRDTDDSFDMVMLFRDRYGDLHVPPWIASSEGSPSGGVEEPSTEVAEVIAACTVRVSVRQVEGARGDFDAFIAECERATPGQWRESYVLRGQIALVLDLGEGDSAAATVGGCRLEYSRTYGLRIARVQDADSSPADAGSASP